MKLTQVKEACLYVQDLDRTLDFYHHKLGLPVISMVKGRHVFFRVGTQIFLCFNPDVTRHDTQMPPHFGTGQLHLAFEAEEGTYETWKEKLIAQGIPVEQEQTWREGRKSFYFRDPDQHCIEIVEPGIWGF
jgi:catechol 2,3-dioxygenase-like lactoylglutathione lyase family enzyme